MAFRRSRRPRWCLRTLLLLSLLVGTVAGYVGREIRLAKQSPVCILAPITTGTLSVDPLTDDSVINKVTQAKATTPKAANIEQSAPRLSALRVVKHKVQSSVEEPQYVQTIGNVSRYHDIYQCIVVGCDGWVPYVNIVYVDYSHYHLINSVDAFGRQY